MKRYQPIFDAISQHLAKLSIKPEISLGDPVTIDDLKELEEYLGLPLPIDIRQYLLELGDGFDFRFHSNQPLGQEQHCWIWSMHSINQIKATYDGMREDIPLGLYACEDLTPRLKWIPIWGAGDGGYLFCAESDSGIIRFHDIRGGPSMVIADGLYEWVTSWGRYCFSDPFYDGTASHAFLNSYVWGEAGRFDWCASRFDPVYRIAN